MNKIGNYNFKTNSCIFFIKIRQISEFIFPLLKYFADQILKSEIFFDKEMKKVKHFINERNHLNNHISFCSSL